MVRREVRLERLIVGLHGLALLRGWPLGDPDEADRRLMLLADLFAHRDDPPMAEVLTFDELDHGAAYADWSATYDVLDNALFTAEEPALRSLLDDVAPGYAIDVACGTGRVSAILADAGHRVTGVDPSPEMLELARAKVPSATFVEGPFDRLPVPDASADLVTSSLALTHVEDLGPPTAEIARVVRPGGRVVLSDVHPVAVATGAQAIYKRTDGSRGVAVNHIHWFADYLRAFARAGLVVERCEEPKVDAAFFDSVSDPTVRRADGDALTGLPVALLWSLRRP